MRPRISAAFLVGALLLAVTGANAEDQAAQVSLEEARGAIALFNEGKRVQGAGDFEGAYLLFREADAMYPGALPKYRSAVCLDALGRTAEAVAGYRAFVAFAQKAGKHADLVALARTRLAVLAPPKLTEKVAVSHAAPAARPTHLSVDPAPESNPLPLRVTGFVLLGAALATGAALAATFAQSRMTEDAREREEKGTAATILAPITASFALGAVIVLPLGYREPDTGDTVAGLVTGARF
jgi:hypothetical protein